MKKLTYQTSMKSLPVRARHEFDANGKILGKLAVEIADLLRGKNKPSFTLHQDLGDFVTVYNIEKIAVTGRKLTNKLYYRHSGYIGSLKSKTLGEILEKNPSFVLRKAVERMLPDNRLRTSWLKRLKLITGAKPEKIIKE